MTLHPGMTLQPDGVQWRMHVTSVRPAGAALRVEFISESAATGERHGGRGAVTLTPTPQPGVWRDGRHWPFGRWSCCPEFYRAEPATAQVGVTGDLFA